MSHEDLQLILIASLISLIKIDIYRLLFSDSEVHTKMTVLIQVAFYGAMHKMLKGAYNSGGLSSLAVCK